MILQKFVSRIGNFEWWTKYLGKVIGQLKNFIALCLHGEMKFEQAPGLSSFLQLVLMGSREVATFSKREFQLF